MRELMILIAVSLNAGLSFADDVSHRAAAEDLLQAANTEITMNAAIDTMLDAQLKANKALLPVKDVMRKFLVKHLSYESLKEELIDLHAREFSETELREIAAFYRTPAGKKFVEKQPVLMQQGAALGMRRVQDNQAELQIMLRAEFNKNKPQDK